MAPTGDLRSMSVGELRQRAVDLGAPTQQIEDARDGDDPMSELIALITRQGQLWHRSQAVPVAVAVAVPQPVASPVANVNIESSPSLEAAGPPADKPGPLLTTCRTRSVLILGIIYVRARRCRTRCRACRVYICGC
jgi:hypothetical protein